MENYRANNWEPIDFTVYFRFLRWPVVAGVVLQIALLIWLSRVDGLLLEQQEMYLWALRIVILAFLGWRLVSNFGHSAAVAAVAGALAGVALGLTAALWRFTDGLMIWKFFNLFNETVLVSVVGALIGVIVVYLLSFKK